MTSYCYKCQFFIRNERKCVLPHNNQKNLPILGDMRGCIDGRPVFRSEADYNLPEVSE